MSKTRYSHGWTDPRALAGSWGLLTEYQYEVRYSFMSPGYEVVKRNLISNEVEEVIASGLTKETADGYIKLLKER